MKTAQPNFDLPIPTFLNVDKTATPSVRNRPKDKHADAYEAYCKWAALPQEVRQPTTKTEFEKLWKLPRLYTWKWDQTEDFQAKRLNYFWNWMFDKFPDVVYSIYKRATAKSGGSSADAKIFADIVGKKLDTEKPSLRITPFMLVGVAHEKIEELFTPKEYIPVADRTIELAKQQKIRDGEIIAETV